jgi:4-amino-4-deoxy-L-arabinose transferase-like glycosyltransferase
MVDLARTPVLAGTAASSQTKALSPQRERVSVLLALLGLVLLAAGLRLVPTVFVPSLNWGDEIFQTIEPAHRLVYGYGLVPWEFQLGMRSWLLPAMIAGLIEFSRLLGDGPAVYLPVIATVFALLATAPIVCCFLWCRRWYGATAALIGATAVAIAPEAVYFGSRTLSEVVAAHILVIGCYLLAPGHAAQSRKRLFVAGLVFGLACLLRIQLAPAIALFVLWASWRDWRQHFPALIAGGTVALCLGGALD